MRLLKRILFAFVLLVLIVAGLFLTFIGPWPVYSSSFEGTSYYVFMNPFEMPTGGAEFLWYERVLLNRLGVFATGALMLFLALRRMEHRERFLG